MAAAAGLLWADVVLGFANESLFGVATYEPEYGFLFAFVALITLVYAAVVWCAWLGRNWARWFIAAWVGVGLIGTIGLGPDPDATAIHDILIVVEILIELVAVWLLFTRTSNAWFAVRNRPPA